MVYLSEITKSQTTKDSYPFCVPCIKNLKSIKIIKPVTYLVGENGSGKSTFLESLAAAINLPTVGAVAISQDTTLYPTRSLSEDLKLSWKLRTHKGFFVRSEDVFGFSKYVNKTKDELTLEAERFSRELSGYGRDLAVGAMLGQKSGFKSRYGDDLDANSHGETFLKIFQSRFVPGGLYLLDEPESPLSFRSQLSLLTMIREMVSRDAQFIIATHSPILTAMPEAEILSFDGEIKKISHKEIESFELMREFLNSPESFLRHL